MRCSTALKWSPEVEDRHITVTADEGAVTLSGYVPSYFQKTRAVATAEHVYGVKAVADEVEVRLHDAFSREDSDIAKSVAHILEWNTVLASRPHPGILRYILVQRRWQHHHLSSVCSVSICHSPSSLRRHYSI